MARMPGRFARLAVGFLACAGAASAQPSITINGVTDPLGENNAIAHMQRLTPYEIEITGTPNAPFALLIALDALDGIGGGPDVDDGFYLTNFTAPQTDVPVHAVFDGIGNAQIENLLGLSPGDVVSAVQSPLFRFGATGSFVLSGITPSLAVLLNQSTGMNPIEFPLESDAGMGFTSVVYFQVVELAAGGGSLNVGNGVRVVFDELEFAGTIAYSQGTDPSPTTVTVAAKQTLGTLTDAAFDDLVPASFSAAADFGGAFANNVDVWIIELAGTQPLYPASHSPAPPGGFGTWTDDPDNANDALVGAAQKRVSGIEFLTGTRPALNLENPEFPRIMLPGNRQLFQWRNGSNPGTPSYGFGVLFADTGTFRNLVPPAFATFQGTATRSCWDFEVGVTPDGDRALVVFDDASLTVPERVFVLNLEPGGNFANGFPIAEVTPSSGVLVNKIYEESITFLDDGQGDWVGFFCASSTTAASQLPQRLMRVNMTPMGTIQDQAQVVLPGPVPNDNVAVLHRQPFASADHERLVIPAGPSNTVKDIYQISNVGPFFLSIDNLTQYPGFATTDIAEWSDATDGNSGFAAMSPDGSVFAFARKSGNILIPNAVRTDGSSAGSVADLIADTAQGGLFDLTSDFNRSRDYFLTEDDRFLLFFQGTEVLSSSFRFDVFRKDLVTGEVRNLTRTIGDKSIFGPWDIATTQVNTQRPSIDPGGSFTSPNGKFWYFFRDCHGLVFVVGLFDRFNLIAVDVEPGPGGGAPSFALTNVTGTEFEATPGAGVPAFGAPDLIGEGQFTVAGNAAYHQLRRVGGGGPLDSFFYLVARKAQANINQANIDQLFLFDSNAPAPALTITSFATDSMPFAAEPLARMSNVVPSQQDFKVAFVLDPDGPGSLKLDELFVADLAAFAVPRRIPAAGTPFSRLITRGSVHFVPTTPVSLVFGAGTVPRPAGGQIDGIASPLADPANPIDAAAFFHRFDDPAAFTISPAVGADRRALMVWGAGP